MSYKMLFQGFTIKSKRSQLAAYLLLPNRLKQFKNENIYQFIQVQD